MNYQRMKGIEIFKEIDTEEKARQWVWKSRFAGKDFVCPQCEGESFWQHKNRPEVRECDYCRKQIRLRAGTIFRKSKIPILTWLRMIGLVMQGKRGISALELQRQLGMPSYDTVWRMLHKIRESLRQRDENYQLKEIIELDGAVFGKREKENQAEVLVAVESKEWIDEKGRKKEKAGFAKIKVTAETKWEAQAFVDQAIQKGAMINTDASPSLRNLENVDVEYQVTANDPVVLNHWLPWVHRFYVYAQSDRAVMGFAKAHAVKAR